MPQAPPKTPDVEVDGVHALKLTERVTLLRGICNDRFKFEVEYGLKRGTSDNCYVVRVRALRCSQRALPDMLAGSARSIDARLTDSSSHAPQGKQDVVLFDVPDQAWLSDFGETPLVTVARLTMQG